MAVDMQFFVFTPILLSIYWRKPAAGIQTTLHFGQSMFLSGYITTLVLLAGGTASQIYFTIRDDEYFHGSFDYYVKPWNRSQPYLIGIVLGHTLHK